MIEELDRKLKALEIGQTVTVIWYNPFEQNYTDTKSKITKISPKNQNLKIENSLIFFDNIYEICRTKNFPISAKFTFNKKVFTPQDNIANANKF